MTSFVGACSRALPAFLALSTLALTSASVASAQTASDYPNVCFAEGTDPAYVERFLARLGPQPEYFLGGRWSGVQGSPRVVTWSLVPDGVVVGGGGEPSTASDLFSKMDTLFAAQGGRATWILRFQQCFDRWEELSGVDFQRITFGGNDWDDGATFSSSGSSTRGDIRIGMHEIDNASNVLGYTFFPSNGNMVLDHDESWGSSSNLHRFMRNIVTHELGHAVGIDHVCSSNSNQLMEPFLSTSFDGPRQDDIRAVQRHYGDPFEDDNTTGVAINLGTITTGVPVSIGTPPNPISGTNDTSASLISIDANAEMDFLKFTVTGSVQATITVQPIGSSYDDTAQAANGSCPSTNTTNALTRANLNVDLIGTNGTTVLATAASQPAGVTETITNAPLGGAGTYFIKVYEGDSPTQTQGYKITLTTSSNCVTDSDGDGTPDCTDGCPNDPNKVTPGVCGCGVADTDTDGDGTPNCNDACPTDPNKTSPGLCGCGVSDVDTDGDGVEDCNDGCPLDDQKNDPGVCGCGNPETDTDGDGVKDCVDGCPTDPAKTTPGQCGCGNPDTDTDGDGVANCIDGCPTDATKTAPGQCGCGNPDTDTDGDGVANCVDGCPTDPTKTSPGLCGCGSPDVDSDGDGLLDCNDNCPNVSNTTQDDLDGDGAGDVCDNCPADSNPTQADCDGDGAGDVCEIIAGTQLDANGNGIPDDCEGSCPAISTYCTAKVNSAGCTPFMNWSGSPSASAGSGFFVTAEQVLDAKVGLLYYSINGPGGGPFQGGHLCATPPTKRTPLQTATGTGSPPCIGVHSFDFNVRIASGVDPTLVAGVQVWSAYWTRDAGVPSGTGLTNGLTFTICP